jgi:hypothetical protein
VRALGLVGLSVLVLSPSAVFAEDGAVVFEPEWTSPITGHSRFGNGYGFSAHLSYFPDPSWHPLALAISAEYACSDISTVNTCWERALGGVALSISMRADIELTIRVLAGVDYIGLNKLGPAGMASVGPTYVDGQLSLGVSVDVLYSYIHGEDTEGGNFPDPTGTLLRFGANIGVRW